MQDNANPSIDPSNENTLAGLMQFVFSKFLNNVDGMLPAKVIAYDRTKNRVQVQLLIALITTDGQTISRAQFASLPVLALGGGGFLMSFNLQPGNLGWVIANDRDISNFLNTYSESTPNTVRKHSFSDGVFIPDVMTGYTIVDEDANNAVLQSLDGTVKISLGTDKIKIQAPMIELDATSNITLTAPEIELNGDVIINDTLTVNGLLDLNGGLTSTGGSGPANATFTGDVRVVGNVTASGNITPNVP